MKTDTLLIAYHILLVWLTYAISCKDTVPLCLDLFFCISYSSIFIYKMYYNASLVYVFYVGPFTLNSLIIWPLEVIWRMCEGRQAVLLKLCRQFPGRNMIDLLLCFPWMMSALLHAPLTPFSFVNMTYITHSVVVYGKCTMHIKQHCMRKFLFPYWEYVTLIHD